MRDQVHYQPDLEGPALDALLRAWRAAHPGLGVLLLLPEAERAQVPVLQARFREAGVPLLGAVFPALVAGGGFVTRGALLLRLDERPYAALHRDVPAAADRQAEVADRMADGLRPHLGGEEELTLLLLCDAMSPSVGTLLDELYLRLADRVHYMGANAGSETFQPIPCLFDEAEVVQGGALVVLLRRGRGAVLEHGYPVPAHMTTATSTAGNRIVQIDWRPAFEVYRELARAEYGVEIDRDNFYQYAVHFPFGVVRANGVILVRIPVALTEDGSLFCVGEVAPHSVLTLLKAPAVDSALTTDTLLAGLGEVGGPVAGSQLLLFYCAGRRLHLGPEAAGAEVAELTRRSGAAQVAGALSLGEIGSPHRWAYPLFHNAALLASRWGGP